MNKDLSACTSAAEGASEHSSSPVVGVSEPSATEGDKLSPTEAMEAHDLRSRGWSYERIADWFGTGAGTIEAAVPLDAPSRRERTGHGLRDMLFDEIERVQRGESDPSRAAAVANLARQIVGVAKVEMDFLVATSPERKGDTSCLGTLQLGTSPKPAAGAGNRVRAS